MISCSKQLTSKIDMLSIFRAVFRAECSRLAAIKGLSKRKTFLGSVLTRRNFILSKTMSSEKNENTPKADLKRRLTPVQYHVTQEKGTEYPYSGEYNDTFENGSYLCVVCRNKLFSSDTKYDSGCGWPAFVDVVAKENVKLAEDTSHGMVRTEVTCSNCGAHLGHVFDDGPQPTGVRYCINSASLHFKPKNK